MSPPTLLQRHQIDDEAWNALIEHSVHPVIYAYTWYLDCVSPDWQALIVDNAQDAEINPASQRNISTYLIVMPLPVRKKWGTTIVHQPLFCQYLGLFSQKEISEEILTLFLESLNRCFAYVSVYDFHPRHTSLLQKLLPIFPDFEVRKKATHWLNLEKSHAELTSCYSHDRQKNLKKSKKCNWQCSKSKEVEPLIALFRENHAFKIQNVKESAYVLLHSLANTVLKQKAGSLQYASLRGEIHAGVMILEKNGTGIYIFNAADEIGRKGNARTFLLDRYFQRNTGQLETFDFESPEVESIARFYQSFGAECKSFISIKKNKLPFPLRQLQEFRQWVLSRLRTST
ncbi:hypothetical protein [Persicitalea sp.]|uniref:hypothetical protein n=1 Tax=Persicitalea sp. TaxID=3100273 RepID=UPI00359389A7